MNAQTFLILPVVCSCVASARAQDAKPEAPSAIFVMNRDGSAVRRVVVIEAFGQLAAPRFSRDGRKLAFQVRGSQPGRLLTIDTSGRNLVDLGAGARPDWSPDDKQIVFEVPTVGRTAIWVQNADGKGNSWLTNGIAPRWSPDGSRIAMGGPMRIFDVVTAEYHNVPATGDAPTLGCDWSPDGKQLAVVVKRGPKSDLLLIDAQNPTKDPRVRLTGELDGGPAWSPDGKQLAVTLYDPAAKSRRIALVAVEGEARPQTVAGQQGDNFDPAWSPDGKQIAFASTRRP
jgi:Tol biopolymer transport system component